VLDFAFAFVCKTAHPPSPPLHHHSTMHADRLYLPRFDVLLYYYIRLCI
jgi:hypothetical protein